MTLVQVAEALKVSPHTVRTWTPKGAPFEMRRPGSGPGGKEVMFFDAKELKKWRERKIKELKKWRKKEQTRKRKIKELEREKRRLLRDKNLLEARLKRADLMLDLQKTTRGELAERPPKENHIAQTTMRNGGGGVPRIFTRVHRSQD